MGDVLPSLCEPAISSVAPERPGTMSRKYAATCAASGKPYVCPSPAGWPPRSRCQPCGSRKPSGAWLRCRLASNSCADGRWSGRLLFCGGARTERNTWRIRGAHSGSNCSVAPASRANPCVAFFAGCNLETSSARNGATVSRSKTSGRMANPSSRNALAKFSISVSLYLLQAMTRQACQLELRDGCLDGGNHSDVLPRVLVRSPLIECPKGTTCE